MPLLSNEERQDILRKVEKKLSRRRDVVNIGRQDLLNAVNAMDTWIDDNMVGLNGSLTDSVKTGLSLRQKLEMFLMVIENRWGVS